MWNACSGLVSALSTLGVGLYPPETCEISTGSTLGSQKPPQSRDLDWASLHYHLPRSPSSLCLHQSLPNCFWTLPCVFFNVIFTLYWGVADLHCCVHFKCTAKWFSYTYTYIPPFSDSLGWVSQMVQVVNKLPAHQET